MAKKIVTGVAAELRKEADNLVLGTEETVKLLRKGQLRKVFLASNCKPEVKSDVESLAKLTNVDVQTIEQKNTEIGVMCRKPFSISVVGVRA